MTTRIEEIKAKFEPWCFGPEAKARSSRPTSLFRAPMPLDQDDVEFLLAEVERLTAMVKMMEPFKSDERSMAALQLENANREVERLTQERDAELGYYAFVFKHCEKAQQQAVRVGTTWRMQCEICGSEELQIERVYDHKTAVRIIVEETREALLKWSLHERDKLAAALGAVIETDTACRRESSNGAAMTESLVLAMTAFGNAIEAARKVLAEVRK